MHTRTCQRPECARKFRTVWKDAKYCSRSCSATHTNKIKPRKNAGRKSKAYLEEQARLNQPPRPPAEYDNHKIFPYYIARL